MTKQELHIKSYLSYVFKYIVDGLEGETKELVEKHGFIAGGALRSLYLDQPINDIDVYFDSQEVANKVRNHISETLNNRFGFFSNILKMHLLFNNSNDIVTNNAYTFKNKELNLDVQLIYKFAGKPDEVIDHFDFTNSQAYYIPSSDTLCLTSKFKKHNDTKVLEFNPNCYSPVYTFNRLFKFMNKGYKIDTPNFISLVKAAANDTEENHESFKLHGSFYL